MSDRKVPYPSGYPQPQLYSKRPIEIDAEKHENNRQAAVTKVLVELFLVAVKGHLKKGQPVGSIKRMTRIGGAKWQSWVSTDDNQAAHCVPRQLFIRARSFDRFLGTCVPDREPAMIVVFAETDDLPANFNRADSLAEGKGIAEGFREACVSVIDFALNQGKFESDSAMQYVSAAYEVYRGRAKAAYRESQLHLKQVLQFKTYDKAARARREERLKIIQLYNQALGKSAGHYQVLTPSYIKSAMTIYSLPPFGE
jgi:hypothetical protein